MTGDDASGQSSMRCQHHACHLGNESTGQRSFLGALGLGGPAWERPGESAFIGAQLMCGSKDEGRGGTQFCFLTFLPSLLSLLGSENPCTPFPRTQSSSCLETQGPSSGPQQRRVGEHPWSADRPGLTCHTFGSSAHLWGNPSF